MKKCPVGAELFHSDRRTDGETDMTELKVAFRSFTNAPKKNPPSTVINAPIFPLWHFRGTRCEYRTEHQLFSLRLFVTSLSLHTAPLNTPSPFPSWPFQVYQPPSLCVLFKTHNCCSCYVIRQPSPQQIFHEIFLAQKYAIYKNCEAKAIK